MTDDTPGPGYDPAQDVVLDARSLRGVAHPLRLRLLGSLRNDGPQTATQLAARLGESSGATSYHLRTLAAHGFVTDASELGQGRERFWRASHRSSWFATPDRDAPERELAEIYLQTVARTYAGNIERWSDEMADWPQDWVEAANLSNLDLRLTPAEAGQLADELMAVLARWRDERTPADDESAQVQVSVQFQVFPRHGQLDKVLGREAADHPDADES